MSAFLRERYIFDRINIL